MNQRMTVGEVISALCKYASDMDDDNDYMLMCKSIYGIDVKNENRIEIIFLDGNTQDVAIDRNGRLIPNAWD